VGPNGIGKSTLLGLIGGALAPTRGYITRSPKCRIAVFAQHHVDGLDLALTPLQYMAKCFPEAKEPAHRGHLSSFGVPAELAAQAMYTLSGGQKSRVALAKVRARARARARRCPARPPFAG
jgi:ATP-binding cassette subfamily F protein 3